VVVQYIEFQFVDFFDSVYFFHDSSIPVFEAVFTELCVGKAPVFECVVEVVFHHLSVLCFDGVRHVLLPVTARQFDGQQVVSHTSTKGGYPLIG